jgi:hypothetical protein
MVVKRGLRRKAAAAGWTITELDPWDRARIGQVVITATPAKDKVLEGGVSTSYSRACLKEPSAASAAAAVTADVMPVGPGK